MIQITHTPLRGLALCMALLLATAAMAQTEEAVAPTHLRSQSITLHPLRAMTGVLNLAYEHTFAPYSLWYVEGSCIPRGREHNSLYPHSGVALQGGYKFLYPLSHRRNLLAAQGVETSGLYLKTALSLTHQRKAYDIYTGNDGWHLYTEERIYHSVRFCISFAVGYQLITRNGILFGHHVGFGIPLLTGGMLEHSSNCDNITSVMNSFFVGCTIGYAF